MGAQAHQDKHSLSDCIPMVAFARALAENGPESTPEHGASSLSGRHMATAETESQLAEALRHIVASF